MPEIVNPRAELQDERAVQVNPRHGLKDERAFEITTPERGLFVVRYAPIPGMEKWPRLGCAGECRIVDQVAQLTSSAVGRPPPDARYKLTFIRYGSGKRPDTESETHECDGLSGAVGMAEYLLKTHSDDIDLSPHSAAGAVARGDLDVISPDPLDPYVLPPLPDVNFGGPDEDSRSHGL